MSLCLIWEIVPVGHVEWWMAPPDIANQMYKSFFLSSTYFQNMQIITKKSLDYEYELYLWYIHDNSDTLHKPWHLFIVDVWGMEHQ